MTLAGKCARRRRFGAGTATLVGILLQVACGGADTPSSPTPSPTVVVRSIAVTLARAGSEYQATAVVAFSDGSSQDVTADAAWSSSDSDVATVSASGRVSTLAPGTAEIRAAYRGVSGSASLTVPSPPGPPSPTPPSGRTFTLSGDVRDASTNSPLAAVQAEIVGGSDGGKVATTDSAGHYLFARLAEGTFQVYFRRDDYRTEVAAVALSTDQTLDVTLHQSAAPPSAPVITTHPSDQSTPAGGRVTFVTAATGSPTPAVQWQASSDGGVTFRDIDATAATYSFTARPEDNGWQFRAVFSNSAGNATSRAATLTILADYLVVFNLLNAETGTLITKTGSVFGGQLTVLDGVRAGTTVSGCPIEVRVPAGTVSVRITADGYVPVDRQVNVSAGGLGVDGAIREDVPLQPIFHTFSGLIHDAGGAPIVNVSIQYSRYLSPSSYDLSATTATNATGAYVFQTMSQSLWVKLRPPRGYECVAGGTDLILPGPGENHITIRRILSVTLPYLLSPLTLKVGEMTSEVTVRVQYDSGAVEDRIPPSGDSSVTPSDTSVLQFGGFGTGHYRLKGIAPGTATATPSYCGPGTPITVLVVP